MNGTKIAFFILTTTIFNTSIKCKRLFLQSKQIKRWLSYYLVQAEENMH